MTFTHNVCVPFNLFCIWLCMMQFRFTLLGNNERRLLDGVAVRLMKYVNVSALNV